MAICNNENLPNGMKDLPKEVENFAQFCSTNPLKHCPRVLKFAKVVEFRKIWSHCPSVHFMRHFDEQRFLHFFKAFCTFDEGIMLALVRAENKKDDAGDNIVKALGS